MMIEVYDNLYSNEFIQDVYDYVRKFPFENVEIDTEETHISQGKSQDFDVKFQVQDEMMKKIEEKFKHRIAKNLKPYRVYCNKIINIDTPQSHYDSKYDTDTTVLYYVNPEYNYNWGGETMFYDEDKELIKAVMPRPGRVAIFPANILHSARSFALYVTEPRYTIAFKYMFSI
jgi:Rps23 Pro-64 3,4-dihydroxylase Tpa1-like proline 4-hydroxylase